MELVIVLILGFIFAMPASLAYQGLINGSMRVVGSWTLTGRPARWWGVFAAIIALPVGFYFVGVTLAFIGQLF